MKKLVVYKHSKLEWDSLLTGLSRDELITKYKKDGANVDQIVKADEHQRQVREWCYIAFSGSEMESLEDFTLLGAQGYDLVIAIGGDNSFTRVSQFCKQSAILGINSDPDRSTGHLLQAAVRTSDDVVQIAARLHDYAFEITEWQRIQCTLNGQRIRLGTSEVFLGEKLRKNMSRYVIDGKQYKSSGLLVYTGAGSTGWALASGCKTAYPPTFKRLGYIHTELFTSLTEHEGYISDSIRITSLNDDGIVSVDSWEEWPFNRGSVAEIAMGLPLKILRFPVAKKDEE